jgi:hypothetical protein
MMKYHQLKYSGNALGPHFSLSLDVILLLRLKCLSGQVETNFSLCGSQVFEIYLTATFSDPHFVKSLNSFLVLIQLLNKLVHSNLTDSGYTVD